MGSTTIARSTERPRNSRRASTHANGTPSNTDSTVAASDTSSDRRSAARAPSPASTSPKRPHGALATSATTGSTTKAAPITGGDEDREGKSATHTG